MFAQNKGNEPTMGRPTGLDLSKCLSSFILKCHIRCVIFFFWLELKPDKFAHTDSGEFQLKQTKKTRKQKLTRSLTKNHTERENETNIFRSSLRRIESLRPFACEIPKQNTYKCV